VSGGGQPATQPPPPQQQQQQQQQQPPPPPPQQSQAEGVAAEQLAAQPQPCACLGFTYPALAEAVRGGGGGGNGGGNGCGNCGGNGGHGGAYAGDGAEHSLPPRCAQLPTPSAAFPFDAYETLAACMGGGGAGGGAGGRGAALAAAAAVFAPPPPAGGAGDEGHGGRVAAGPPLQLLQLLLLQQQQAQQHRQQAHAHQGGDGCGCECYGGRAAAVRHGGYDGQPPGSLGRALGAHDLALHQQQLCAPPLMPQHPWLGGCAPVARPPPAQRVVGGATLLGEWFCGCGVGAVVGWDGSGCASVWPLLPPLAACWDGDSGGGCEPEGGDRGGCCAAGSNQQLGQPPQPQQ
jgi:hypothetical protein